MAEPFLGEIILYAGERIPRGYQPCDGRLLQISENSALFAIIGTHYGGDGVHTFAVPNLKHRVPVHNDRVGEVQHGYLNDHQSGGSNFEGTVSLRYLISTVGIFPEFQE